MKNAAGVLRFLIGASARGERSAIVTLTDVIGRSSRAAGTQMGVSENGSYNGSFSGGCVEAAVVAEAQRVIETGRAATIRFGDASPFIDIRLPCGGGIDLLITPCPSATELKRAADLLAQRVPALLLLARDGAFSVRQGEDADRTGWVGDEFHVRHNPDLRLVIAGHGEETRAMATLASAYGAQVITLSPDRILVDDLVRTGINAHLLKIPARTDALITDRYSAVVMLFHDHDWETELLAQALEQDAFFIGAMGSRATHAVRVDALLRHGVTVTALERLVGPIGLIPATRDPETLALSALGQVAIYYEKACEPVELAPNMNTALQI